MKGKVWAAVWGLICLSWLYDFAMLFYGIDGSKVVQGCAYIIVAVVCAEWSFLSLSKGDQK